MTDDNVVEPQEVLPEVALKDLSELMQNACAAAGWEKLMPVQAKAIPYILGGRDLMIQSRTGSGKTGAFLLPILDRIDAEFDECQVLILVPTRELAQQVASEAETLSGDTGIRAVAVYGGVGYQAQLKAFRSGAHLVIGTPGRVLDHLIKGTLSLHELDILVFDEADRMMSMGFYPDMKRISEYLPKHEINGYMFSATFPPHVLRLAGQFLQHPEVLSLSRDHVHVLETEHIFYRVKAMDKDRALVRIIEVENPESMLIFCNTKQRVHYVSVVLQRFGYDADELSADLAQSDRERIMTRARSGDLRFLVATDVATRGIDIPDLSHVVQFEPPQDPEAYVHRAGRTGRAGASGEAISLVDIVEEMNLRDIAKRFKIDMLERPLPSDEDVESIVSQRLTALLEARLRSRDKLIKERMQRFVTLARRLGGDPEESGLLAMLLDDYYQHALHGTPSKPAGVRPDKRVNQGRSRPRKRSGGRTGRR